MACTANADSVLTCLPALMLCWSEIAISMLCPGIISLELEFSHFPENGEPQNHKEYFTGREKEQKLPVGLQVFFSLDILPTSTGLGGPSV